MTPVFSYVPGNMEMAFTEIEKAYGRNRKLSFGYKFETPIRHLCSEVEWTFVHKHLGSGENSGDRCTHLGDLSLQI